MRKLILAALAVALTATVVPGHATNDPQDDVVYACVGRAGVGDDDTWHFESSHQTSGLIVSTCRNTADHGGASGWRVSLHASEGTVSCGDGVVSGTGKAWFASVPNLTWHGTFEDGVGTITGIARNNGHPTLVERPFSGTIRLPTVPGSECDDAQPEWPAHNAVATFVIE